jgi:geranylgeranyl diphosphate synthase type II
VAFEKRGPADFESLNAGAVDALRQKIDSRLCELYRETPHDTRLVCAMRHALLSPGKRFRPIITLLAHAEHGGDIEDALDAACAIEMVHAASLIMDDLPSMDDARLRRGRLATHVVFGEGTGMLAAVSLLNEAYRVIANGKAGDPAQKIRAISYLTKAVGPEGLAGGQERDIMCGGGADGPSLNEIEQRHLEKTGALFAAAAAIGAELAGANEHNVRKMHDYGVALGLAYQAFDDVIDVESTTETAGKDVSQDEGKSTVVSLLGRDGARLSAGRWLQRAIDLAEEAKPGKPALLAALARKIGAKFGVRGLKDGTAIRHGRPQAT